MQQPSPIDRLHCTHLDCHTQASSEARHRHRRRGQHDIGGGRRCELAGAVQLRLQNGWQGGCRGPWVAWHVRPGWRASNGSIAGHVHGLGIAAPFSCPAALPHLGHLLPPNHERQAALRVLSQLIGRLKIKVQALAGLRRLQGRGARGRLGRRGVGRPSFRRSSSCSTQAPPWHSSAARRCPAAAPTGPASGAQHFQPADLQRGERHTVEGCFAGRHIGCRHALQAAQLAAPLQRRQGHAVRDWEDVCCSGQRRRLAERRQGGRRAPCTDKGWQGHRFASRTCRAATSSSSAFTAAPVPTPMVISSCMRQKECPRNWQQRRVQGMERQAAAP